MINSTIADNDVASPGAGGGLDVVAGTVTLNNSIFALNTNGIGIGAAADDITGTVSLASAYNLIGTGGSGGLVNGVNGNLVGIANPGLDPNGLQDNGGPTQTIALLTTSPAIDAGSNALAVDPSTGQPLAYDQRGPGYPRIVNGTVDIGSRARSFPGTRPAGGRRPLPFRPPLTACVCFLLDEIRTCRGWESTKCRLRSARPNPWPPPTSRSRAPSA